MSNIIIDAVIFDCDGTLASIEGITELAKLKNKEDIIRALTEEAMNKTGLSADLYEKRLDIVKPSREDCVEVAKRYIEYVTPDAKDVIQQLQQANKSVYILSAGVDACVLPFAAYLGISAEHVYSVPIFFDDDNKYAGFDETCPLIDNQGKYIIGESLSKKHSNMIAVGDGMNDVSLKPLLHQFIGFGGSFYRENIKRLSDVYITQNSLNPVLKLCLTPGEHKN